MGNRLSQITRVDLTNRSSQPLTGAKIHFHMTNTLHPHEPLAHVSSGSAPSR